MDGDFDRDHEQDRGPFKEPAKDGEGPVNWKREASQPPEGGAGTGAVAAQECGLGGRPRDAGAQHLSSYFPGLPSS